MKIKPKKITLKDIAEIAGVSSAAVSGVLNNSPRIKCGKSKRDLILSLAKKHNYAPNSSARALAVGRTGQIGFLVAEMATLGLGNAYFALQLSGIEKFVTERGYLTTVSACNLNNINKFVFPDKLKRRSVDGLFVSGPVFPEVLDIIKDIGTPAIICCDPYKVNAVDTMRLSENQFYLSFNNRLHHSQAISFFYDLGHRKIFLSSLWYDSPLYCDDAIELIHRPLENSCTFQQGVRLGEEWCREKPEKRFTAVLGSNQFCLGFIRFLNSVKPGLCPDEVSVLSLDSVPLNEYTFPSLSSCSRDPYMYGDTGARILLDCIEKKCSDDELEMQVRSFYNAKIDIIERESTGPGPTHNK